MNAMAATSWTTFDRSWYPNSGATDHITLDGHNLVHKTSYTGHDQIHVGNGTGLTIDHIGSSSLNSQFNSKTLTINHLLHVPSISKNLLSMSKFSSDNTMFSNSFRLTAM